MAQNNGDLTAKECRVVMKYHFLKGNSVKKIYYMSVTLGDKHPSYSTVKNLVARFRTGYLGTEDEELSRRPTQVTIPENVDAIHSIILDDKRISTKKIADTLAISQERVGFIVHKFLDMRNLSAKWVPKCRHADQKSD
jgi:transposase